MLSGYKSNYYDGYGGPPFRSILDYMETDMIIDVRNKKQIDYSKPAQTLSGKPVEILTGTAKSIYPIVGLIEENHEEVPKTWTAEGKYSVGRTDPRLDLQNVPPEPIVVDGYIVMATTDGNKVAVRSILYETSDEAEYELDRLYNSGLIANSAKLFIHHILKKVF